MFLLVTASKQTDSFILPVAPPRENGGSSQPSKSTEQQDLLKPESQNTQTTEGGLPPMSNGRAEIPAEDYVELTQSSPVTSADPLMRSHHMEQSMSEMEEIHQLPQRETSS